MGPISWPAALLAEARFSPVGIRRRREPGKRIEGDFHG
jgi:hypothetical protein